MNELMKAIAGLIESMEKEEANRPWGPPTPEPIVMPRWLEGMTANDVDGPELFRKYLSIRRPGGWWCYVEEMDDMRRWHYQYPCILKDHPDHGLEPCPPLRVEDMIRPMTWHEKNGLKLDSPWM